MAQSMRVPMRRERAEDEFISAYTDMLGIMRKLFDLGGDPNIKAIIEKAEAALGRVPH
jgi:hypothetical protein